VQQPQQKGPSLAPPRSPTIPSDIEDQFSEGTPNNTDSHGVALKAAKDKWNELGPLRLEDIMANSKEQINQTLTFGQSKYNKHTIG